MNIFHITNTSGEYESRLIKMAECAAEVVNDLGDVHVIFRGETNKSSKEGIKWIGLPRLKLKYFPRKLSTILDQFVFFWEVYKIFSSYRPTAIHCHTSEQLPFIFFFSVIFNSKVVYEPHELEFEKNGAGKIKKYIIQLVERFFIPKCALIIVVGKAIADEYVLQYNMARPLVVMNLPKNIGSPHISDYLRTKFSIPKDRLVFLYQGGLLNGRGVNYLLEQFSENISEHLVFLGYGSLESKVIDYSQRYPNIHFHKAVPPEDLLNITASADVGCCFIEPVCKSYELAVPNKFFEYLTAGIPAMCNEMRELDSIRSKYPALCMLCRMDKIINFVEIRTWLMDNNDFCEQRVKFLEDYSWERQTLKMKIDLRKIYESL